jgi:type II restriction enzyme
MSSSEHLRKTHTTMGGALGIHSAQAISQEKSVITAVHEVIEILRAKYPQFRFTHEKTIDLQDVCSVQRQLCSDFGVELANDDSSIRPDGGFVFVTFDGVKKLILSCEAKQQGTNMKRLREGKSKQSKGNAIERSMKNYDVLRKFMDLEPYFPYAVFASGCDLSAGSSIRDRVTSSMNYSAPNKIYVRNVMANTRNVQRASIFLRERHWNANEIRDICLKIAEEALAVVISYYDRNDIAA